MYQPHLTAAEFALIARVIWLFGPDDESGDGTRDELARHFADELARTHPLFDRARFIRAATTGVNSRTKEA